MSSRAVDLVVRRLATEANPELSAHVLRHPFVTNLIRSGTDRRGALTPPVTSAHLGGRADAVERRS